MMSFTVLLRCMLVWMMHKHRLLIHRFKELKIWSMQSMLLGVSSEWCTPLQLQPCDEPILTMVAFSITKIGVTMLL